MLFSILHFCYNEIITYHDLMADETTRETLMNKRVLLVILVVLVFLFAGWIYYVNSQMRQPEPVEKISAKWWGSAHADIEAEAFVHWNEDDPPEVPTFCAKCHSGQGFLDYIGQDGSAAFIVDEAAAVESVISCEICHNEQAGLLETVIFPSGMEISLDPSDAVCATCHSGMGAGTAISPASAEYGTDEVILDASFINPHYAFAAATWLGSEAGVGYEYPDKEYVGRFIHAEGVQTCTQCHDPHSSHIDHKYEDTDLCSTCHSNVTGYPDYRDITVDGIDYDGDGTVEGTYHEIQGVQAVLYAAMQQYAQNEIGLAIGWADQYPYLFTDTDEDGTLSEDEASFPNAYKSFTPRLLRAAFNYQFSLKDPAGYVHNGKYVLQLLFDCIEDLSSVVDIDFDLTRRP